MGAWNFCVLSAGKPMSTNFLFLGGGLFWAWKGGKGSADFIFMGVVIFLKSSGAFSEQLSEFRK